MAAGPTERRSRATDPPAAARANTSRRDWAFVVLASAIAVGFFLGQWLVLTALSGRLDMIERILLEQGGRCGGAQVESASLKSVDAAPGAAAAGAATGTAEAAADGSAAPTSKPTVLPARLPPKPQPNPQ